MTAVPQDQFVFGSQAMKVRAAPSQARTHVAWGPPDDDLSTLCGTLAEALPPAAHTAVVIVPAPRAGDQPGSTAVSIATSSASTTAVVRIEWLLREGPLQASLASGTPTVSSRLDEDRRWPRFARAVPAHDAASVVAVPIPLAAEVASGVLAAYSDAAGAFDPRDVRVLTAFATVLAGLVAREPVAAPALAAEDPETSRLVNQAVGVLMTHGCDEEQALRRLRRISGSTHQPLVAAAQLIVLEAQADAHVGFLVGPADRRTDRRS